MKAEPYSLHRKLSIRPMIGWALVCFLSPVSLWTSAADEKNSVRYLINSTNPKYPIALMIYDAQRKAWPNYCMGKPDDGGWFTTSDAAHSEEKSAVPTPPYEGAFRIHFTSAAQSSGDQNRRILGETMTDGDTDVVVELLSLGETRDIEIDHNDDYNRLQKTRKSPDGTKEVQRTRAKLKLTVRGTSTEVDAEVRIKRAGKTSRSLDSFFSVNGSDLGLKEFPGLIHMRLYVQARTPKE